MTSGRVVTDGAPRDRGIEWRRQWREDFGEHWKIDIGVMTVLIFLFGAIRPLSDPDLPMHLSAGEWIVRHRAVPFIEPFSWTRAGSPYLDFSWMPQVLFYLVLNAFGHVGLRVLQGLIVTACATSAMIFARTMRLRPAQGVILAGLHVIVGEVFVAMLRPQSVLLITLPLIWAGFLAVAHGRHTRAAITLLFVASAVTASSHLFFPLTLAPACLLLVYPRAPRTRSVGAVACVVGGWLLSPYSFRWIEVLRDDVSGNLLFRPPSAISELQPGFVSALHPHPGALLVLSAMMLVVPWVLADFEVTRRERAMAALGWGIGLIAFGYASRLFVLWWLLAMMPSAWAIVRLSRGAETRPPRASFRLVGLIACTIILVGASISTRREWSAEGDTSTRRLPSVGAWATEPLARRLETRLRPGVRARLLTTFNNGSYLTWRLPGISASIDSRGVFPDSVTAAEAVVLASDRDVPLGPWRSADAAIVPVRYRIAAVLDTASGWRRIATAPGIPMSLDSVGLWARDEWWAGAVVPTSDR